MPPHHSLPWPRGSSAPPTHRTHAATSPDSMAVHSDQSHAGGVTLGRCCGFRRDALAMVKGSTMASAPQLSAAGPYLVFVFTGQMPRKTVFLNALCSASWLCY